MEIMVNKNNLSRISIDIPSQLQQKLKALAALNSKSMREVVIESIERQLQQLEQNTVNMIIKKEI